MQFRFENLADFVQMSGHGPYVWACYIAGLVALAYIAQAPARKQRAQARRALRLQKLKQAQAKAAAAE